MTDTIPQPPCDSAVGRAQKNIRDAAASARAVDYVDHTKWSTAEEIRWYQDAGLWRRVWTVTGIGIFGGLVIAWWLS